MVVIRTRVVLVCLQSCTITFTWELFKKVDILQFPARIIPLAADEEPF